MKQAQLSSEKEALVVMMTEMEKQMNQLSTAQPTVVEKKNDVDSAEVISKKNAENEKWGIDEEWMMMMWRLLIHNHSLQQELEERENLIVEMKKRQDELMRQASDARSLRDEVRSKSRCRMIYLILFLCKLMVTGRSTAREGGECGGIRGQIEEGKEEGWCSGWPQETIEGEYHLFSSMIYLLYPSRENETHDSTWRE